MSAVIAKSVNNFDDVALKFVNPEIYGKGKILGDIMAPIYDCREWDDALTNNDIIRPIFNYIDNY